ncbi:hypothetical protein KAT36_01885 [Candidatus Pacearchaeota archaeon]|nr:hypothetical protein [Candidatus Pacearchaeota archaeon]
MKGKIILVISIIVLAVLATFVVLYKDTLEETRSEEYYNTLSEIQKGNNYILEKGLSDNCFPYRYFHRGCYYGGKVHYEGLVISHLLDRNLTHEERINLCYEFAFNGSVAYCLQQNKEIGKCNEFAKDDEYLERICGLKENETIPTEGFYSSEYKDNPIPIKTVAPQL